MVTYSVRHQGTHYGDMYTVLELFDAKGGQQQGVYLTCVNFATVH